MKLKQRLDGQPIQIIQVGAGVMGKSWMKAITESHKAALVGVVDLDIHAAASAARALDYEDLAIDNSLSSILARVNADAVVNVTSPEAHSVVNKTALFSGLPVLCEKPIAPTVADALSAVAAAEVSGQLLMISQSRRYYRSFAQFAGLVDQLGDIGTVTCECLLAPRFVGFRQHMRNPILADMAIHHFDAARCVIGQEPISVYCSAYNPTWSWYEGSAEASALIEFERDIQYLYHGSWCSLGKETSANGCWRVGTQAGSASWDGEHPPRFDAHDSPVNIPPVDDFPEDIRGSLDAFINAVQNKIKPRTEAHSNVVSLAMVEAAIVSADTKERVTISDVLNQAFRDALELESGGEVSAAMESWPNILEVVGLLGE